MGYKLPEMEYADGIRQHTSVVFGGINHNLHAQDGELYDAENLTTELYPLMGSRPARSKVPLWNGSTGMCNHFLGLIRTTTNALVTGDIENHILANLTEYTGFRELIPIGKYILIMPDKLVYDASDNTRPQILKPLDTEVSVSATFTDGTLYGEAADANTIHAASATWTDYFKVGDGVQITSTSNTVSAIIREIDGEDLKFYENTFITTDTAETVTVARKSPYFGEKCVFEHKNRLWAYDGNTVYASKLGDPFNWNFFDGTAEDSYSLDLLSGYGYITAGTSYTYPTFFKRDRIYRIYGDKPSQFQSTETIGLGALNKSCAVINNVLYYLSDGGVMAYSGSTPTLISRALGYVSAVVRAGTDGTKYYLSAKRGKHSYDPIKLHIYDPRFNVWQIEDDSTFGTKAFAFNEFNFMMLRDLGTPAGAARTEIWSVEPDVWYTSEQDHVSDAPVQSFAEFGDFIEGDPNSKTISKLLMRVRLGGNAVLQIKISIDDGAWEDYATLENPIAEGQPETKMKRSKYLAIVPRRCDHFRLKLIGTGEWILYSLTRETASGSQFKTV